jgi:hypothetical protein
MITAIVWLAAYAACIAIVARVAGFNRLDRDPES